MAEKSIIEEAEDCFEWDIFDISEECELCVLCGNIQPLSRGIYVRWIFSDNDFICFDCFNDRVAFNSKNWELFYGKKGWYVSSLSRKKKPLVEEGD